MFGKSKLSKEEKRGIILDYCSKVHSIEQRFVSKREIRDKFHIELYNYFENVFDLYQQLGINVPLCYCPKDYARKKIIEFVRKSSESGLYPTGIEIINEFGIHITTYFSNLQEIYKLANVDYGKYLKRCKSIENPVYSQEQINEKRSQIVNLIRKKAKQGRYPSVNDIQRILKLKFDLYFSNIKEAYKFAKIKYQRPCPIILGRNKEIILTKIMIILFEKMGYAIDRVSIYDTKNHNQLEDLKITDKNHNTFLVELKAYRREQPISMREISQLVNYMGKQDIAKGLLVTTSNKIFANNENIEVINGDKLISLLNENNLSSYTERIWWVQDARVNLKENIVKKESKMKEIKEYILNHPAIPTVKNIQDNLNLDLRTYFRPPLGELIKKIKLSNGSTQVYKGPLQVH